MSGQSWVSLPFSLSVHQALAINASEAGAERRLDLAPRRRVPQPQVGAQREQDTQTRATGPLRAQEAHLGAEHGAARVTDGAPARAVLAELLVVQTGDTHPVDLARPGERAHAAAHGGVQPQHLAAPVASRGGFAGDHAAGPVA